MKTILSLIITLLIAYSSYGQSSTANDSTVTIPLTTANNIQRQLADCNLAKLELDQLYKADSLQQIKIQALQMQISQHIYKQNKTIGYALKLEKQYKKQKAKAFVFKIAVPVALIGGFYMGSR